MVTLVLHNMHLKYYVFSLFHLVFSEYTFLPYSQVLDKHDNNFKNWPNSEVWKICEKTNDLLVHFYNYLTYLEHHSASSYESCQTAFGNEIEQTVKLALPISVKLIQNMIFELAFNYLPYYKHDSIVSALKQCVSSSSIEDRSDLEDSIENAFDKLRYSDAIDSFDWSVLTASENTHDIYLSETQSSSFFTAKRFWYFNQIENITTIDSQLMLNIIVDLQRDEQHFLRINNKLIDHWDRINTRGSSDQLRFTILMVLLNLLILHMK